MPEKTKRFTVIFEATVVAHGEEVSKTTDRQLKENLCCMGDDSTALRVALPEALETYVAQRGFQHRASFTILHSPVLLFRRA